MSDGIEEVGYVQWDLLGYLILAWTVVYCVIWKGLHNSGKVPQSQLQQSTLRNTRHKKCATIFLHTYLMCIFHNFYVAIL